MHAVGVPVLLCFVFFLPERNKEMQGKARTSSSKGERGRAKARTNKARKLTHRGGLRDGAKHGVAQSKPDRERKADRVVEAKHLLPSAGHAASSSPACSSDDQVGRSCVRISASQYGQLHMIASFREPFFSPPCPGSMVPRRRGGAGAGPRMCAPAG